MILFLKIHGAFILFSVFALTYIACLILSFMARDPSGRAKATIVSIVAGLIAIHIFHTGHRGDIESMSYLVSKHFTCADTTLSIINGSDPIYFVKACGKTYLANQFFGFLGLTEATFILPDSDYVEIKLGN